MNFSPEWDELYKQGAHKSVWPWSDVVRLVHRYIRGPKQGLRVLELGFGAGANIPFFKALGMVYHSNDGSELVVERARERFPVLAKRLVAGDFTRSLGFRGPFDLILDRGALTHNSTESIRRVLALVRHALAADGIFIGVDWFSTSSTGIANSAETDDPYTRRDISAGRAGRHRHRSFHRRKASARASEGLCAHVPRAQDQRRARAAR
jgi:SAM-dependent methyltransferase